MMQRCCTKLRSLAAHSSQTCPSLPSSSRRLLLCSPHLHQPSRNFGLFRSILNPSLSSLSPPFHPSLPIHDAPSFSLPVSLLQVRYASKLKKYKIKGYSSFKSRFKCLSDGTIRRWRAGKRHNAHLKSKKSKLRLRKPSIVHPAYAKVMKKLGFCA